MPAVRMERTVGGSGLSPPAAAVGAKRTTHYREGSEEEGREEEGREEEREEEKGRRKGEEEVSMVCVSVWVLRCYSLRSQR